MQVDKKVERVVGFSNLNKAKRKHHMEITPKKQPNYLSKDLLKYLDATTAVSVKRKTQDFLNKN